MHLDDRPDHHDGHRQRGEPRQEPEHEADATEELHETHQVADRKRQADRLEIPRRALEPVPTERPEHLLRPVGDEDDAQDDPDHGDRPGCRCGNEEFHASPLCPVTRSVSGIVQSAPARPSDPSAIASRAPAACCARRSVIGSRREREPILFRSAAVGDRREPTRRQAPRREVTAGLLRLSRRAYAEGLGARGTSPDCGAARVRVSRGERA